MPLDPQQEKGMLVVQHFRYAVVLMCQLWDQLNMLDEILGEDRADLHDLVVGFAGRIAEPSDALLIDGADILAELATEDRGD